MNAIPDRQNAPEFIRFLRARSQVYRVALRFQITQLALTITLPFAAGIAGVFVPGLRPYAAAYSVLITILDMSWFDRAQRSALKKAAQISEQFDCELLDVPENKFITGTRVEPELIERANHSWSGEDARLKNWYPVAAGKAPLKFARIICQRANLQYDSELRKSYGRLLVSLAVAIVLAVVGIGALNGLPLVDLLITTVPPAGPIIIWALRERFRQRDTANVNDGVRREAEAFWEIATHQNLGEEACRERSREFQDAIFRHRSSSPLLFPFIYKAKRNQLEREMNVAAERMLIQIGIG